MNRGGSGFFVIAIKDRISLIKIVEVDTFEFAVGSTMKWADVFRVHKTRNGIYQRNGNLVSLLTDFGRINPCYPDFHGSTIETIHYTGSGRRGDQKLDAANRAMIDAIASRYAVPLFNKLAVNRWEYLGLWHVTTSAYIFDEARQRMTWKFTLELSSV